MFPERLAEVRLRQERLLQERRELWARKERADEFAKTARPQAELQRALEALPGLAQATAQAKARVQELDAQEAGLGWWNWIERRRIQAERPKAEQAAKAQAQRLTEVRELVKRPVREKVEAVVLNRSPQAAEALIEFAQSVKEDGKTRGSAPSPAMIHCWVVTATTRSAAAMALILFPAKAIMIV